MKVGCCSLTELEKREDSERDHGSEQQVIGVWRPILVASGDHLKGGSSREWGFEDVEVEEGRVGLSSLLCVLSHPHECWFVGVGR